MDSLERLSNQELKQSLQFLHFYHFLVFQKDQSQVKLDNRHTNELEFLYFFKLLHAIQSILYYNQNSS